MVRKLSLAIALALGLTPFSASALGLGDIKSKSSLNQQFNADIELLSVGTDEIADIKVILASEEVFAKAGLNRPYFLSQLRFTPVRLANGKGIIRVTTKEPVREPFLNFLIEVNWPKGRLYREYTVLLDPPATLQRAPAPVRAAQRAPARAAQPAVSAAPAIAAPTAGAGQFGPTQRNDTLWNIAKAVRHDGTTMEQMVMALFRANPGAFLRQNINNLRVGQILRVPERAEVLEMTAREARTEFWDQVNNWRAGQDVAAAAQPSDASEAPAAATEQPGSAEAAAEAPPTEPEAELKIARTQAGEESGSRTGDSAQAVPGAPSELQQELIEARETRESALEESRELKGRVESLASQLEDLQRLLELKDEQLARLQAALGDTPDVSAETEAEMSAPQPADATEAEMSAPQPADTQASDEGETADDGEPAAMPAAGEESAVADDETILVDEQAGDESTSETEMSADTSSPTVAEPEPAASTTEQPTEPGVMEPQPVPEPEIEPEPEILPEPELATEPEPEPVPMEPVEPQAPASFLDQLTGHPLVKKFSGDPTMMGIGAGVVILLLVLIWLLFGRKRKVEEEFQESILVDTADDAPAMVDGDEMDADAPDASVSEETSFLSDFSPSEIDALPEETGEVDPLAEADVYIAYGRYGQAENLVKQGLERTPDNIELKLKLFEILFATKNAPAFTQLAEEAAAAGMPSDDKNAWESVVAMGAKLVPGNALFEGQGGAAAADIEEGIEGLEDLDLGDLSASLDADQPETKRSEPNQSPDARSTGKDAELESELDLDLDALDADGELDLKSIAQDLIADESVDGPSLSLDTEEIQDLPPLELDDVADTVLDLGGLDEGVPSGEVEERLELPETEETESLETVVGGADEMGSDEINTKLDLARAYVDMGDTEGARSILQEVVSEGSEQQQAEARRMLDGFA